MKTEALAALLALTITAASADQWTGQDKTQHAIGGFAIGSLTTALTKSKTAGCLAGSAVGALKEVADSRSDKHTASGKDFAVTAIASCLGAQFSGLFISPNRITYRKEF